MIFKNTSKSKLTLAFISIVITFFVWQQGLRDSLNRPSVSFDISQKEQEIAELSVQSIPVNLKKFFIINDPVDQINKSLSDVSFEELTERNKLIRIITSESNDPLIYKNISKDFEDKNYKFLIDEIEKKSNNNTYKANSDKFDLFKGDRFLYHLLSRKFDFDDSALITKSFSSKMFLKILAIRLIPLLTILIGSILALKILWTTISLKKFGWKEIKSLDLELIDMVLLIAGGFVVLGEVVSPLFSISLVELFSKNISNELSQSLKIFFGYLFMAIPPLWIVFYQIKSLNGEFTFKKDYLQFNFLPIKYAIIQGIKGWLTIVPFVLLISLIMNSLIDNQNGSNPLLEIVLNNNNYLSFFPNSFKRFWSNFGHHSFSFYLCISPFKFGRNAAIIYPRDWISNYKNCFREFVFLSDYAFFMEWIDFLKFVFIEDIKNLIFYLRIKQKDVYLINNTSFIKKINHR